LQFNDLCFLCPWFLYRTPHIYFEGEIFNLIGHQIGAGIWI